MKDTTTVTDQQRSADAAQQGIEDLRELIAALDARVPRLERGGEVDIARDAATLKHAALERIAELETAGSGE